MGKLLVQTLFRIIFYIASVFGELFFRPLIGICVAFFPDIEVYGAEVVNFFILKVCPVVSWIKSSFLTITGFPEELFLLYLGQIVGIIAAASLVRTFVLVLRIIGMVRGKINLSD